jgi:hypothetical protein
MVKIGMASCEVLDVLIIVAVFLTAKWFGIFIIFTILFAKNKAQLAERF